MEQTLNHAEHKSVPCLMAETICYVEHTNSAVWYVGPNNANSCVKNHYYLCPDTLRGGCTPFLPRGSVFESLYAAISSSSQLGHKEGLQIYSPPVF